MNAAARWVGTYNTGPLEANDVHLANWSTKSTQRALKLVTEIRENSSIVGLQQFQYTKLNEMCKAFNSQTSSGRWKLVVEGRTNTTAFNNATKNCASGQVIQVKPISDTTLNNAGYLHDVIAYDSTKYQFIDGSVVYYTESPKNSNYHYGYIWSRFYELDGTSKKKFTFINTYMTNKGTKESAAKTQMNQLISKLNTYETNGQNKNIIVVGDFNLSYQEASRKAYVDKLRNKGYSCNAVGKTVGFTKSGQSATKLYDYVCAQNHLKESANKYKYGSWVNVYKSVNNNWKMATDHFIASRRINFPKAK